MAPSGIQILARPATLTQYPYCAFSYLLAEDQIGKAGSIDTDIYGWIKIENDQTFE